MSNGLQNTELELEQEMQETLLNQEILKIKTPSVEKNQPSNIEVSPAQLEKAIQASARYLLNEQHPDGYWHFNLYDNITLTSEYVMFMYLVGVINKVHQEKACQHIIDTQNSDGSFSVYYGAEGDLSATIEAYHALKLAGFNKNHPALIRARKFILDRGGVTSARVFTKINLAMFGEYPWECLPNMPPELILLPKGTPFNFYEFSSWSRAVIIPLTVLYAFRPLCKIPKEQGVSELFLPNLKKSDYLFKPQQGFLTIENLFIKLDRLTHFYEKSKLKPLRKRALKKAEEWIVSHQDYSGHWGGIYPAMMNSCLALKCLGYKNTDTEIKKGIHAIEHFLVEEKNSLYLRSTVSPVWDTAITLSGLKEVEGLKEKNALQKATNWLMTKQGFRYGDWYVKNKRSLPGGWSFEFNNDFYPDIDDTALVLLALHGLEVAPQFNLKDSIKRGIDWTLSMQNKDGGWAAFDKDNKREILNKIPFADLKSLLDPSCPDITGHVLEALAPYGYTLNSPEVIRAIEYLQKDQAEEGCFYGRWGVNYIYGTSATLCGLAALGENMSKPWLKKAARWLINKQNPNGGWGESCKSYDSKEYWGKGQSTPSQTAWAIMGLIAANYINHPAVLSGINYLITTQNPEGNWDEREYTGTGFPRHFYLRYGGYKDYFPLIALTRFKKQRAQ